MTDWRRRVGHVRVRRAGAWALPPFSAVQRIFLVGLLITGSCSPRSPTPLPLPDPVTEPDPEDVESVVFLYGDAGAVHDDNSPLLSRLRYDIERWSASLEGDSSVIVIALGDIVYPDGVRSPDTNEYPADTAIAMSQVRLVTGPYARDHGARAFILAGNHDWAGLRGWEGVARLRNLDYVLERARTRDSAAVRLVPTAGTGGPFVIDVGDNLRILMIDTAWWLLESSATTKAAVLQGVDEAIASAGDREIVIATHHPFKSGGPHGGNFAFWQTAGARYLLSKSGAILQDVTSVPYRELEYGLRDIFERHGVPLVFAGGHEHSLQVIDGTEPTDPTSNLVSGAGSKLSNVGPEPGLRFARSSPGYMRLIFEKDGGVTLFVESADRAYLKCPDSEPERAQCMANGFAAFSPLYSQRLR